VRVTPECDTIASFPICNRADAQFSPSVVFNGENYIVTWTDRRYTGMYFWATAARVTSTGAVLDTGYCIGAGDNHSEFYPNTAYDGTRCFTVWYNSYYEPFGIFGRFVNTSALPEDTVITIGSTQTYLYNYPKVEFGANEYFVVWADRRTSGSDYDIFGQLVSPDGQMLGGRITIANGDTEQKRPDVSFDGSRYLVVWTQENCIYGQRVTTNGQLIGTAFRISELTTDFRDTPRCCAGTDNFFVVWSQLSGTYLDIYANIETPTGIYQGSTGAPGRVLPATIVRSGRINDIIDPECTLYDISGRQVPLNRIHTGIFFVQRNCIVERKIIVVR
jgi:hypothetical protein